MQHFLYFFILNADFAVIAWFLANSDGGMCEKSESKSKLSKKIKTQIIYLKSWDNNMFILIASIYCHFKTRLNCLI